MIHLSETGFNAGRRFCGITSGESVHAMYAPLDKPEYRKTCCPKCLKVWADEAYDMGEEMPAWVQACREGRTS